MGENEERQEERQAVSGDEDGEDGKVPECCDLSRLFLTLREGIETTGDMSELMRFVNLVFDAHTERQIRDSVMSALGSSDEFKVRAMSRTLVASVSIHHGLVRVLTEELNGEERIRFPALKSRMLKSVDKCIRDANRTKPEGVH
jgi:hypothetical protein